MNVLSTQLKLILEIGMRKVDIAINSNIDIYHVAALETTNQEAVFFAGYCCGSKFEVIDPTVMLSMYPEYQFFWDLGVKHGELHDQCDIVSKKQLREFAIENQVLVYCPRGCIVSMAHISSPVDKCTCCDSTMTPEAEKDYDAATNLKPVDLSEYRYSDNGATAMGPDGKFYALSMSGDIHCIKDSRDEAQNELNSAERIGAW